MFAFRAFFKCKGRAYKQFLSVQTLNADVGAYSAAAFVADEPFQVNACTAALCVYSRVLTRMNKNVREEDN